MFNRTPKSMCSLHPICQGSTTWNVGTYVYICFTALYHSFDFLSQLLLHMISAIKAEMGGRPETGLRSAFERWHLTWETTRVPIVSFTFQTRFFKVPQHRTAGPGFALCGGRAEFAICCDQSFRYRLTVDN